MRLVEKSSALLEFRRMLGHLKRQIIWLAHSLGTPREEMLFFRCNVCGRRTSFPRFKMNRESWSCRHCSSSVRFRSVVHALSMELFGSSFAISDFPSRPDLVGIGLSDWNGYASRLPAKLHYTNTYYHTEPRFDITAIDPSMHQSLDFLISTDVFEHVCQPISRAFSNARSVLKADGVMIFTVPYVKGQTKEHFPEIVTFSIEKEAGEWILEGKTKDGRSRRFSGLTFHGGPGTVLEFRLFGQQSLFEEGAAAGFDIIRIYDQEVEEFGIVWNPYVAEQAPYRPLIFGLDTPPWAFSSSQLATRDQA